MMRTTDVLKWLSRQPDDAFVAIDDGGLTLVIVDAEGLVTDQYCEIGGVETDDERIQEAP